MERNRKEQVLNGEKIRLIGNLEDERSLFESALRMGYNLAEFFDRRRFEC